MQERLRSEVPAQDRDAIAQMRKRGLEVSTPADAPAWREVGNRFSQLMDGRYVPADVFERARAARDAFRREHGTAQ
jgi:TRAP-type C4-dicarboxylate transport system substrate-binding protein